MKLSKYYMPTLKQEPKDADVISAKLLLRAGMIRKNVAGVYTFLPMGLRVLKNIEAIIREEMDEYGGQEVLMSALQPKEIWEESGRWEIAGPEMYKLTDRHNRDFCLGPTHEEYFTSLIRDELNSYKQLPLNLYQIQTKYRDERRPRFGLIRSREFLMKDAYTFDMDEEGLEVAYKNMWDAYESIFTRMGLDYKVVRGDSGNMGGNYSHEFHAITPNGESTLAYCDACGFSETDEVAKCVYEMSKDESAKAAEAEKIATPNIKTIQDLEKFFNVNGSKFIKSLLFKTEDEKRIFAVMLPGDRELNIVKLAKFVDEPEDSLLMLEPFEIHKLTGSYLGFVGPYGLDEKVEVIGDSRVFDLVNGICGANEVDFHLKNVNLNREDFAVAEDLLQVKEGDLCPKCGKVLNIDTGTEVGNIFQLGLKYSESMKATFLDKDGKAKPFYMGSYGIGVSRCVAAVVEQNYDDRGIVWPLHLAPYEVIVTIVNHKKEAQVALGEEIYATLKKKGYSVMLDDRKASAGIKFADRDLIGIPLRVTAGRDADDGIVEFSARADGERENIAVADVLGRIEAAVETMKKSK